MPKEVQAFAEIEAMFLERVHQIVWCNVATINTQNRPRSRILHPLWEGATGFAFTWHNTLKAKHLQHNPYVSLAYVANPMQPVYADCYASWEDDMTHKQRIWQRFASEPAPLGYDAASIFARVDHPDLGLLRFVPWRIEVFDNPATSYLWRAPAGTA